MKKEFEIFVDKKICGEKEFLTFTFPAYHFTYSDINLTTVSNSLLISYIHPLHDT